MEKTLTDNIVHDFFASLDYKKLSREEELHYIRRAKLSFYDDVDDKTKELFLHYYGLEFPEFIQNYNNASSEEKKQILEDAIADSLMWRNEFINNNQRFISYVVTDHIGYSCDSFSRMDIIQEGNFGLIKAIEKFDVERGVKFSTYAIRWIKEVIVKALANGDKAVRIPANLYLKARKLNSIIFERQNVGEKIPSALEISELLNVSETMAQALLQYVLNQYSLVRLDSPMWDDDDTTIGDVLLSDDEDITITYENKVMKERLLEIIDNSSLNSIQKNVLKLRFGFNGSQPQTLQHIGNIYGMSSNNVHQIEKKALTKLRSDFDMIDFNNEQTFIETTVNTNKTKVKKNFSRRSNN